MTTEGYHGRYHIAEVASAQRAETLVQVGGILTLSMVFALAVVSQQGPLYALGALLGMAYPWAMSKPLTLMHRSEAFALTREELKTRVMSWFEFKKKQFGTAVTLAVAGFFTALPVLFVFWLCQRGAVQFWADQLGSQSGAGVVKWFSWLFFAAGWIVAFSAPAVTSKD